MKKRYSSRYLIALLTLPLIACLDSSDGSTTTNNVTNNDNTTTALTSEGSVDNPVQLSVSGLPYSGTVDASSTSYYTLQGMTPGLDYAISFDTISSSIYPQLYDSATLTSGHKCFTQTLTNNGSCIAPANSSGEIYLKVNDSSSSTGTSYTINAALATETGQGSTSSPFRLTAPINYNGTLSAGNSTSSIDPGNSGYYQITGLTPGNRYALQLNNLTIGADLYVYQDSFSAEACRSTSSGTLAEYCLITAKGNTILARVRAQDSGSFTLISTDYGIAPTPPSSEGTPGGEVILKVDDYHGSYDAYSVGETSSYYTVTGLVPGQQYTTTLIFLTDNANLFVYNDNNYSVLSCSSLNEATTDELCTSVADANGQLWFKVDGSTALADLGATYLIEVKRDFNSQGSSTEPQIINAANELPMRLTVGNGATSYYKVTGLAANTTYLVSHNRHKNLPAWAVYPPSGFGSSYSCTGGDVYNHCSGTTNDAGEMFLLLTRDYYGIGGTAYVNISTIPTAEGSTTSPLVKDMSSLPNGFRGGAAGGYDSAYELTGLAPNTSYHVLVTFADGEKPASVGVYSTFTGDLATQTAICGTSYSSVYNNGCTATTNADGKLWVALLGGWSVNVGSHFTVEVLPVPISEGGPLDITAMLPYRSTVRADSSSSYMVTGLTPNSEYLFSRDSSSGESDLVVYADSLRSNLICLDTPITTSRNTSCVAAPVSDAAYIYLERTYEGVYSSLNVTPIQKSEGSGLAPLEVIGSSHSGSVNLQVSMYKLNLAANTTYTISLTNVSGDPDLYVFNTAAMDGIAQCSSLKGEGQSESCQATSDSNGNLWVVVDGSLSRAGANYLLQAN